MPSFSVDVSVTEKGRNAPEYQLQTDLNGEQTLVSLLDFLKTSLIIISDEVLTEEQANGFDKEPVLTVDGRKNKPIEQVSPFGQVEFTARADLNDIVTETYNQLLDRSKVLTGQYKEHHYVFYNGTQVATNAAQLATWLSGDHEFKDSDIIRIINVSPYARKLERYGITAQRSRVKRVASKRGGAAPKLSFVPNGDYALTARAIKAKYKRNNTIRFTFISGDQLGLSQSFKKGRRKSVGRPYLYPTIIIVPSDRGNL